MKRHQNADRNYIEQGIKLLEVARNAPEFFRTHGQEERAQLLQFILHGSTLENDTIIPVFRPPFDIINSMAADAWQILPNADIKKQAASNETACPAFLPRPNSILTRNSTSSRIQYRYPDGCWCSRNSI
jgi:hypothetical protein